MASATQIGKWQTERGRKLWWSHWLRLWLRIGNYVRAGGVTATGHRPVNSNRLEDEE
jgi:hypothetical protein